MRNAVVSRLAVGALVFATIVLLVPHQDGVIAQSKGQPDLKDVFDCTVHGIKIVKPSGEQWQFASREDLKDMNKPGTVPTPCLLQKPQTPEVPIQVDLYVRVMEHTKGTKIKERTKSGKEIEKELSFNNVKGVAQWLENELRERDYKDIKEYARNEKKGFKGAKKTGLEFTFKAKSTSGDYPSYCRQVFIADNGRTYQLDLRVVNVSPDAAKEGKDFTWDEKLKKEVDFIFDSFTIYKVKPPVADDQG
jgi:hypothetical protein